MAELFSSQEKIFIDYLSGKENVSWEELAKFSKNPSEVKKKTLQKVISTIKKKCTEAGQPVPFKCNFYEALKPSDNKDVIVVESSSVAPTIAANAIVTSPFVKVRTTRGGNMVPETNSALDAHIDFVLDKNYKRVVMRKGKINLSDNEWELFCFFHQNAGKKLSLEQIKEHVYKNFGSKTPYHWAESIKRTMTKLRTNIPELKKDARLLTIVSANTTYYMFE